MQQRVGGVVVISPSDRQGLMVDGLRLLDGPPLGFCVAMGECVSVSGPSGSGKTLLLRALVDLDPHSGRVAFNGIEASMVKPAQWRRRLGLLLAESGWWGERVEEHFPPSGIDDGLRAWLALLGFGPGVMQWRVARLSSGERQRLALLRLLALRPRVLLLDEPTANLDPESRAWVEQIVDQYRQREQSPVLWVSHDAGQRQRVAQRHLQLGPGGLTEQQ